MKNPIKNSSILHAILKKHNNLIREKIKNQLYFFWISSFIIASILYSVLWLVTPNHSVFGSLYRMFLYHYAFPFQYIAIPCFFYGIFATLFTKKIKNKKIIGQIGLIILIMFLTILISSPVGGMLWHFHDMQAGYFPENWIPKMINQGATEGLVLGWYIIMLSSPYNIFVSIICFLLTKKGAEIYNK